MEKEVSSMVDLMVGLIAVSAVLGMVTFTVLLGRNIMSDVIGTASNIDGMISVGFIEDLAKGEIDNEMPTATAFNVLTTYDNAIGVTGCGVCGAERELITQRTCLSDHMTGRVQLEVLGYDGKYISLIHKGDCNWYVGACTCPSGSIFNTIKQKHGF